MNPIAELGDNIIIQLAKLKRPVVKLFQEGLTEEEIRRKLKEIDFYPSQDLINLYTWRNGTGNVEGKLLHDLYFYPWLYFLSLEDAIEKYKNFVDDHRWDKWWLPIFETGGGDFIISFSKEDVYKYPVILFLMGVETEIEFKNLDSMFKTILECYETNAYFVDDDNYLDVDFDKQKEIAHKYNPEQEIGNPSWS